jgi:hypothetical protein
MVETERKMSRHKIEKKRVERNKRGAERGQRIGGGKDVKIEGT